MLSLAGPGCTLVRGLPHRQSLLVTQPQSQSTKDPLPHRPKANDEHRVSSADLNPCADAGKAADGGQAPLCKQLSRRNAALALAARDGVSGDHTGSMDAAACRCWCRCW